MTLSQLLLIVAIALLSAAAVVAGFGAAQPHVFYPLLAAGSAFFAAAHL